MTFARYKFAGFALAFGLAGLALTSPGSGIDAHWRFIVGLVVMLGMLVFAVADWRLMDEASREAHKTAAVSGAALGVVLWAMTASSLMFAFGVNHEIALWGHTGSLAIFVVGGLVAMTAQAVCFLLALAGWWILRR